jgi:predicted DNA-binding transcriptional regulator YafY
MPEYTQLERALRILQRMMTYGRVTVQELCDDLFDGKETVRTIQRTLRFIEGSNIPLEIERGAHGTCYYSLPRAFKSIPVALSSDEVLAAILLSQFSDYFQGTQIGEDIATVFEKIDQLVPPGSVAVSSAFRDLSDTFLYHEPGRLNLKPRSNVLRDLFRAILERRVCSVTYSRSGKTFDIHPYSLLFHSGSLYAVVFQPKHEHWIYLVLPRIEEITPREDSFERDPSFKLKDFVRDKFGIWSETPQTVKIRFDKTVASSIAERIWHPSQTLDWLEGGDLILSMTVGLSSELLAWVMRWERYAQVLEPADFRQKVREALEKTLSHYSQNVTI